MSDDIQQHSDIANSVISSAPWWLAIGAALAGWMRSIFSCATKGELKAACIEQERRSDKSHNELREDIKAVGKKVDDLTTHLLRRREDKGE